jgi:retron-type reverse transcriptase
MSIDAEKAFDNIQHHFTIKALRKLGIEGMYLNIVKAIFHNPTANIILHGEKLKLFPLKTGIRQGCPVSPLLFNIVLELLARAIRQEEEIKGIQIGKETVKISLFADDIILYLKDPKKLYPNTPRYHKQLQQSGMIHIQLTKIISFLYTNNEHTKKEYTETIPFIIASKTNLTPRSKLNKVCE